MTLCDWKEFISLLEHSELEHTDVLSPLNAKWDDGPFAFAELDPPLPKHQDTVSAHGVQHPSPLIKPSYSSTGISALEFDAYVTFIEHILRSLLPEALIASLSSGDDREAIEKNLQSLNEELPFLGWNDPQTAPCTLCISLLCHSEFTSGVGRYLCDITSRWLIPGKFLNISSVRSLNFSFVAYPEQSLFFHQVLIDVNTQQQLSIIKSNWENLKKEIRLSILAVRHARNVVSIKKLSSEQKKAMIEESIASVISPPSKNVESNIFDQMHNFWLHLSAEDKIQQIQEQFSPYLEQRPKIFDWSIFHEIKHAILLFGDKFTGMRDLRHVSRLISYQYLFRKTLMRRILESPEKRHLSIKLMKTELAPSASAKRVSSNAEAATAKDAEKIPQIDDQNLKTYSKEGSTVIGILGAMNVLSENELFEERHIIEAIIHCLPHVRQVENSFVLDRRSDDPIRTFYLEIEKINGDPFRLDELKELKKNLPHELKESVESILHSILMPRNEEEIMRNIFLLSQQLKYINDLPQVIISFNAQTEQSLQFTVILLRILRDDEMPLSDVFASSGTELKIEELEVKKVGMLRKRYPKESNVFKISLDKKKFLRRDFTIDLFKARQELSLELNAIFKGIRDFNGGILSKQQEVFQELRSLIQEPSSQTDFLLENFFYSLTPPLRQSLIAPTSLKNLFMLMQESLEADFKKEPIFLKGQFESHQLLLMVASPLSGLKEELFVLIASMKIPSAELSSTQVNAHGIWCIGLIYQNRDQAIRNFFYSQIASYLKEWQKHGHNSQ